MLHCHMEVDGLFHRSWSSENTLRSERLYPNISQRSPFDNIEVVQSPESRSHRQLDHLSQQSGRYPTDELCSRATLRLILNDYLDLVYPLIPVVHIPTFISRLHSERDVHDEDFLCLLVCRLCVDYQSLTTPV